MIALRSARVRLTVLGVCAYLLFLAITLPATLLGFVLERASGGALALGEPVGTLWKGRGLLAVRSSGAFRGIADIEWRCNPLSLFTGGLNVALSGASPEANLRASLSVGVRRLRLRNVDASGPAMLLEPIAAAAAFAKPEGRVRATADSLEFGAASVRGTAMVEWTGAGLSGAPRLGDYRLQITGSGERAQVQLSTLHGDLRLSAEGEWNAAHPGVVRLHGIAEPSAERKDLEPLLQLMGVGGPGLSRPFGWEVAI